MWNLSLLDNKCNALKGMIAIGAGTFDPPAFWFIYLVKFLQGQRLHLLQSIALIDLKHLQLINQLKKTIIVLKVINN